jgi:hypothetical protein
MHSTKRSVTARLLLAAGSLALLQALARGQAPPPARVTIIESVDDPGGQPVQRQLKFGDAGWREPVVHAVRNVGKTELLNVRIELK